MPDIKIASLVGCLLITLSASQLCADEPAWKIGVLTDLSGPMAHQGRQTRLGSEIAAAELNQPGMRLQLVIEDHQLQTGPALSAMQKLIAVDRVDAVFSEFTPTSVAVAPLAARAKILFVYVGGSLSVLKENPQAFKTHIDFVAACRQVLTYWKEQKLAPIAVLTPNLESGQLCLRGAREAEPALLGADYDPGQDVKSQLLGLKRRGAAALLNVGYEADQLRMFKALAEIHFLPVLGALENNFSEQTITAWPQMFHRMRAVGFAPIDPAFIAKLKARDPGNSLAAASAAALAYLHIRQIYAALTACRRKDLDCEVKVMEQSAPDKLIGFNGWKDHIARFSTVVRQMR